MNKISRTAQLMCPVCYGTIKAAYKREAFIMTYGEEVYNDAVCLSRTSVHNLETCLQICLSNKFRESLRGSETFKLSKERGKLV